MDISVILTTYWVTSEKLYQDEALKIAIEIGDPDDKGRAYGHLGNAYFSLSDLGKAIEYHEKHLKIAIEIGYRGGEGGTYGNLGDAYFSLITLQVVLTEG